MTKNREDDAMEIPEGWEEFYRESNGRAHQERWGTVNIRFPHPHILGGESECITEFLDTFLIPGTPVGLIFIRPKMEEQAHDHHT